MEEFTLATVYTLLYAGLKYRDLISMLSDTANREIFIRNHLVQNKFDVLYFHASHKNILPENFSVQQIISCTKNECARYD